MGEKQRLQAIVHGRVQGVGFRYFTIQKADDLGLVGYVRNRWDRTVEVVAEGDGEALSMFLAHLQEGPPAAVIAHVDVSWLPATDEFRDFHPRF